MWWGSGAMKAAIGGYCPTNVREEGKIAGINRKEEMDRNHNR